MTAQPLTSHDNLKYAFGSTLKMVGDNRIGGYLITFTDTDNRDLDNEYFDKSTDLATPHDIVGMPLLFQHGLDPRLQDIPIGKFDKAQLDEHGLWAEAILNERKQYEDFVSKWYADKDAPLDVDDYEKAVRFFKGLVKSAKMDYSSGANPNTAVIGKDGHIKKWSVFEGSATHTPADPKNARLYSLKSILDIAQDIDYKEPIEAKDSENPSAIDIGLRGDGKRESKTIETIKGSTMSKEQTVKMLSEEELNSIVEMVVARMSKMDSDMTDEDVKMTEEEIKSVASQVQIDSESTEDITAKAFNSVLEALPEIINKQMASKAKRDADIDKALSDSLKTVYGESQVKGGSHDPKKTHVSVSEDLRWAHLTAEEMQANYLMQKAFNPMSKGIGKSAMGTFIGDEAYLKHMAVKSAKAESDYKDYTDTMAVKSSKPFKADEINASDITGQGDEWVGVQYSTSLWEKARNRRLYQMLLSKGIRQVEVPQGHESTYVLTEGSDPTVYTRQQANDTDTNTSTTRIENTAAPQAIGTGRVLLTPGELVTMVAVTRQATEDSLIPFLPQVNRQLQETMLEHIDKAMMNGDTETGGSANINLIDGTPSSTITSKPYYLVTNGFLKYALVTGSGTSRDGGTLDENDYRLTYKLFPSEIRERREQMVFIIDPDTHDASLDIAAIKTDDVRRTNATITSGILENIYGVSVWRTGFMGLANSAGKLSGTGSNNTLGRILGIYAPYWALGWKRQISFEYDYDIYSASNVIAVGLRMGMVARGAGASTVSYNLTV